MSGICGVLFTRGGNRVKHENLEAMCHALGTLQIESNKGQISFVCLGTLGLGAKALEGDLSGTTEVLLYKRPLALAFHGNLYNLGELFDVKKDEINPLKGLLHLYEKQGISFVKRLRGEFTLALWDGVKEILYLSTDHFRIHSLLYYHDQEKLVFASTMKGILGCTYPVKRTIHPEALVDVVAHSIIPTPKTIYLEIKKLPPGSVLVCHKNEIKIETYWDITFLNQGNQSEEEMIHETRRLFRGAMGIRLGVDKVSDHIGTFLSGGVDSSSVTGVMTQLIGGPIKTFSIGFEEERFNEINYARVAAEAFQAKHHEYFVSPEDVCDVIPILLEAFDEPYANASAIPTFFCARLARAHGVNILYAGDGGDELFAGNERYAVQRLFEYYYKIPFWLREPILKPLVFTLSDRLKTDIFIKGRKYIQRAKIPYPDRLTSYGFFKDISIKELFAESFLKMIGMDYNPYSPITLYYFQAPAQSELDRQLYIDLKIAISDNDLLKVTRMTEAAGVAVRFPFLDHHLAEFAAKIPAVIKMRGTKLRSFFKKAYADLLPIETLRKKKHGFGLPISVWLKTSKRLNEMMHDIVLSPLSLQRGYFQKVTLEELIRRHKTDETSFYGTALWNLMMLELWHRRFN